MIKTGLLMAVLTVLLVLDFTGIYGKDGVF